jgi:hypothetical protein
LFVSIIVRFGKTLLLWVVLVPVAFIHYAFLKCFLPVTLPALLAGVPGYELAGVLPPGASIQAALILAAMVAIAFDMPYVSGLIESATSMALMQFKAV